MAGDDNYYNLDKRISILEVKQEAMNETIEKIDASIEESYKISLQIKERLDRWNGSIPHMAEDLKELKETQASLNKALVKSEHDDKENSTKTKILWGIVTTIGGGLAGYLIKVLFH
jgi:uncharacterized coiled-coil protein SlyX